MRTLQRGAALAAIVTIAGALAGCNKGAAIPVPANEPRPDTIATVNGVPISTQDFYVALQAYRPQQPTADQPAGIVKLRLLIHNAVIEQMAKKEGVYPTDAQVTDQLNNLRMVQEKNSVQPFDEQLKTEGLTEDYIKRLQIIPQLCQLDLLAKGITITDADATAYYQRHLADMFTKPERAHIKRMVLASQADADDVYAQLQKGASFAALNASRSIDKQLIGGEVPQWLPLDNPHNPAATPLFEAIRSTPPGKVTKPIKFQDSWWIVKIVAKKPREVFDQKSAKSMVRMAMTQQKIAAEPSRYTVLEKDWRNATMAADIQVGEPRYNTLVDELKNPPPLPIQPPQAAAAPSTPAPRPSVQGRSSTRAVRPTGKAAQ